MSTLREYPKTVEFGIESMLTSVGMWQAHALSFTLETTHAMGASTQTCRMTTQMVTHRVWPVSSTSHPWHLVAWTTTSRALPTVPIAWWKSGNAMSLPMHSTAASKYTRSASYQALCFTHRVAARRVVPVAPERGHFGRCGILESFESWVLYDSLPMTRTDDST